jgi:SAM-dependent methyltransferase
MSFLRFLPKRLQQRIRDYAPRGFPDSASCGAFYDARARLFHGDEAAVLEYSSRNVQRRLFQRATAAIAPHGRVLDVGCGLGHLLDFLDDRGFAVEAYTGVDVSPSMVEEASARLEGRSGVALEVRNITAEPFPASSFDVAYIISVLGYPIGRDPMRAMMDILGSAFRSCRDGLAFTHVMEGRRAKPFAFPTNPERLAGRCAQELGALAEVHDDGTDFTYVMSLRHASDVSKPTSEACG